MIADLERRTLALWPPAERVVHDGWEWATSGGYTRRTNSVQPLAPGRLDLGTKIRLACEHFRERGLAPVFKLTPAAEPPALDRALADRGFVRSGETRVLVLDLPAESPRGRSQEPTVEIAPSPDADWFDACIRLNRVGDGHREALRDILRRLPEGSVFARIRGDQRTLAMALGSIAESHVYVGEVVTDPGMRRRGLARCLLGGLLRAAANRGARRALLGVEAPNLPAGALYEELGFREAYRYWYRQPPGEA